MLAAFCEMLIGLFIALPCRDRATYDANLASAVNYTVSSPLDAPASLTYGPSFFTLASQMRGEVTVGLNRQLNNQANSLAAAQRAQSSMGNLYAVELGNEPDCEYLSCRRHLLLCEVRCG